MLTSFHLASVVSISIFISKNPFVPLKGDNYWKKEEDRLTWLNTFVADLTVGVCCTVLRRALLALGAVDVLSCHIAMAFLT